MDYDLHIHSNASDGALAPAAVVRAAAKAGLTGIAITDHDTVAGIPAAATAADEAGIQLIRGVELSCTWGETEIHLLGYHVDPDNPGVAGHGERAQARRAERIEEMIELLREEGVHVPFDAVLAAAGSGVASLGRPHLAQAMVAEGCVGSIPEAFDRYIGNDCPAYRPTRLLEPGRAIDLVHAAGGVAVWAHPPMHLLDGLLPGLVELGLDGLEVFRPRIPAERLARLRAAAARHGLFPTGGSDWHGPQDGEMGEFRVPATDLEGLFARTPPG